MRWKARWNWNKARRRTGNRVSAYRNLTMQYRQRLDDVERRFEELTAQMADPAVISDPEHTAKSPRRKANYPRWSRSTASGKPPNGNLEQARAMLVETDPELKAMAEEEIAQTGARVVRYRGRAQGPAAAQGPQRREKRRARNPRRHGRRRSHFVRGRNFPHVSRATRKRTVGKWKSLRRAICRSAA